MSEREYSFENRESQEQQLVRLLKEKGVEDPEVRKLLIDWSIKQEEKIGKLTGVESSRKAQIDFELKKGHLFFESGYIKEAFENFNDALLIAEQEGLNELSQAIEAEMQKLKL